MYRWQRPTGGGRLPFLKGDSLSQEESRVGVVLFAVPDIEASGVGQGGFPVSPMDRSPFVKSNLNERPEVSHRTPGLFQNFFTYRCTSFDTVASPKLNWNHEHIPYVKEEHRGKTKKRESYQQPR